MKARIDIQTPAGQSLEGFPSDNMDIESLCIYNDGQISIGYDMDRKWIRLHSGDKITIEILP